MRRRRRGGGGGAGGHCAPPKKIGSQKFGQMGEEFGQNAGRIRANFGRKFGQRNKNKEMTEKIREISLKKKGKFVVFLNQ